MTLLQKFWGKVKTLWNKADDVAKRFTPIAINIVEAIKNFNDSGKADFLEFVATTAIPGDADNVLVKKGRKFIREVFPKILIELKIINSIADLTDDTEKLKAILAELNISSVNGIIYKGIAGKALELLADGRFTFDDAIILVTYAYQEMQTAKYGTANSPA